MIELLEVKLSHAAIVTAVVLLIGAAICVRDCVQLYRESPTDGIYKLPLVVAVGFSAIAIIVLCMYCL